MRDFFGKGVSMDGTVARLLRDKGFGFIKDLNGKEYFFHRSEAREFDTLKEGEAVTFEEETSSKGPRAANVRTSG
jgi:CspA family cold shock protein